MDGIWVGGCEGMNLHAMMRIHFGVQLYRFVNINLIKQVTGRAIKILNNIIFTQITPLNAVSSANPLPRHPPRSSFLTPNPVPVHSPTPTYFPRNLVHNVGFSGLQS